MPDTPMTPEREKELRAQAGMANSLVLHECLDALTAERKKHAETAEILNQARTLLTNTAGFDQGASAEWMLTRSRLVGVLDRTLAETPSLIREYRLRAKEAETKCERLKARVEELEKEILAVERIACGWCDPGKPCKKHGNESGEHEPQPTKED